MLFLSLELISQTLFFFLLILQKMIIGLICLLFSLSSHFAFSCLIVRIICPLQPFLKGIFGVMAILLLWIQFLFLILSLKLVLFLGYPLILLLFVELIVELNYLPFWKDPLTNSVIFPFVFLYPRIIIHD